MFWLQGFCICLQQEADTSCTAVEQQESVEPLADLTMQQHKGMVNISTIATRFTKMPCRLYI